LIGLVEGVMDRQRDAAPLGVVRVRDRFAGDEDGVAIVVGEIFGDLIGCHVVFFRNGDEVGDIRYHEYRKADLLGRTRLGRSAVVDQAGLLALVVRSRC
jgi:hypothetical protein